MTGEDLSISTKDVRKIVQKEQMSEQVHAFRHKLRTKCYKG